MASLPDLLTLLRRREPLAASALCRELEVSRATLSRLVGAAGEEVVRLGHARATRYARTRLVEGVGRSAPLHRIGHDGVARSAGRLVFLWGGATWLEAEGDGRLFTGLPPALVDMAPQGYLGHGFASRFPELALPPRVSDWSEDHRLRALALRGEDTVGDLILGRESLDRFLRWSLTDVEPATFPALAERASLDVAGSSAGGELSLIHI